jgi:hypothetical protein
VLVRVPAYDAGALFARVCVRAFSVGFVLARPFAVARVIVGMQAGNEQVCIAFACAGESAYVVVHEKPLAAKGERGGDCVNTCVGCGHVRVEGARSLLEMCWQARYKGGCTIRASRAREVAANDVHTYTHIIYFNGSE